MLRTYLAASHLVFNCWSDWLAMKSIVVLALSDASDWKDVRHLSIPEAYSKWSLQSAQAKNILEGARAKFADPRVRVLGSPQFSPKGKNGCDRDIQIPILADTETQKTRHNQISG